VQPTDKTPHRLSFLDHFLPVWTIVATAAGLALGTVMPDLQNALDVVKIG
jgi:ACR3 family arsenite transporter